MSNRNLAVATVQTLGVRLHSPQISNVVEFLRARFRAIAAWHGRRRDRERLFDYLASDHRAAADIGYPHRLS